MIIQAFQSGRRENIQGDVGRAEVTECRVVGEKVLAPQMWLDGLCSWQPRTTPLGKGFAVHLTSTDSLRGLLVHYMMDSRNTQMS